MCFKERLPRNFTKLWDGRDWKNYEKFVASRAGAGSQKEGINHTMYNSYSRDKSAILEITIPGTEMGSRKHYLSLE